MTPPEHTCSYQNPLNMHQNTKPKQNSRGFFAYSFHPTSLSGHLVFRGQGWNLPFTKTEQGVSWRHRLLFLTTKQDLPINKMSEQTHRTFIGSCKFTLGRQAEPNLAGWMCDHERLYFKGHSAWKSEDKNRGGERAQSHPAGKDYTSWAEAAWLQQGAWPDQGKLGLEARALGSRGWGGSPLLQGCPASTEGWDEPDTPPSLWGRGGGGGGSSRAQPVLSPLQGWASCSPGVSWGPQGLQPSAKPDTPNLRSNKLWGNKHRGRDLGTRRMKCGQLCWGHFKQGVTHRQTAAHCPPPERHRLGALTTYGWKPICTGEINRGHT